MSLTGISAALRRLVRARADGCCEYCGIHESETLMPHEPDHIIAEQHGGITAEENLSLACFQCNRLKGPNVASVDPQTKRVIRLFHPREDDWAAHFRFEGGRLIGITGMGRSTAALLRLNAPERIRLREALIASGRSFA